VLLLDAYPPEQRRAVLLRAFGYGSHVWILRRAEQGESATRDLKCFVGLRNQFFARLPKRSLALRARECWSEGKHDVKPIRYAIEIRRTEQIDPGQALVNPETFQLAT
jgi:hypothetical protein